MKNKLRTGIDLGGTKTEIIVLDEKGNEYLRRRIPTPKGDYEQSLIVIKNLIQDTEKQLKQTTTIGIGTPGAISPATGLLRNANSTCLNEKPFKEDLEALLKREIRLANDANCFALSEAVDGAAAGKSIVFGVIVGTGTGGGVVINQQILTGINAIAGEWGHNPLPFPTSDELPGASCYCGRNGCIETFISGTGIQRDHFAMTGQDLNAQEIVKASEQGDDACEKTLLRYERRMAKSLAHIINVLDPDVIVLGGGMSNVQRLYKNVPKIWHPYIFSDVVNTQLVAPKYGDSSGVRGAAWLW